MSAPANRGRRIPAGVLLWLALGGAAPAVAAQDTAPTPTPASADSVGEEPAAAPETRENAGKCIGRFCVHLFWDRGINYRIAQGVHVGLGETPLFDQEATLSGRIGVKSAVDTAGYVQRGQLPQIDDGIEVRRFFLYTTGEFRFLYPLSFKVTIGLVDASFYVDETYLMLTDLPYVGTFKIGQFDAPMSLDLLSGSSARVFMEAAAPVAALAPGLKGGMQLAHQALDQRLTWAFGYFLDGQTPDVGDTSQSYARLVGRLTWLALAPEVPDEALLHLGLSASYVLSSRAEIRYKARPESFIAPTLVDTDRLDTDNAFPFGAESAFSRGPLLVQGEYLASVVTAADLGDPTFRGGYALAAWMLSGETHPYDRSRGVFKRVEPHHDLSPCARQWGAWEVAARISAIDLTEGSVRGGAMRIVSGGLNWYWGPFVRWMFNYQHAFLDQGVNAGNLNVFQARFELVF
jgi:phosphate-selective porin OprO/OprP